MGAVGISVRQRITRVWRRVADTLSKPPLILMYHRVAEDPLDPWRLCVSPANFAAHMEVIRRCYRPMPLRELVAHLRVGQCPRRAIVVTFDDGYRDNLEAALPRLQSAGVPATVFCTAGYLGQERPFWWDRLAELLLGPDELPRSLVLDAGGCRSEWALGEAVGYSSVARSADRRRRGYEDPRSARLGFYEEVWTWLRARDEGDRSKALDRIAKWSGAKEGVCVQSVPLSHAQAKELAYSPLIEIGAHTVTHVALSPLPEWVQQREIADSKVQLEKMIGQPVVSFAYPFGNFAPETVALVKAARFQSSCTTEPGAVRTSTDPYRLPRIAVGDWDGDTFTRMLREVR
jgi:peptidoglycan/xylan/chitin deacetylase (PgdA/CDA1 family)